MANCVTHHVTGVATLLAALLAAQPVAAGGIVALGASNTAGKGVSGSEAYPAQLEELLHARGIDVSVVNAGINGDTTQSMLARLDAAVPAGTTVVILQPGGNDRRKGSASAVAAIESALHARGIKVVMLQNELLHRLPHQSDGEHLTPEGYHMLAQALLPQVTRALGR